MTYTLFFLGTMDTFVPGDDYLAAVFAPDILQLQQTLSAVATYIQDDLEPRNNVLCDPCFAERHLDIHFLQDKPAVVVDGPDYPGWYVYDKIAMGVILVMNGILLGENVFNLLGFSRGAVIALYVSKELQRIKDALQDASFPQTAAAMAELVCDMPWYTSSFKTHYIAYFTENLTPEHLQTIYSAFQSPLCCHLMLPDPVPGFSERITIPTMSWNSPLHYDIPPIVADCDIILHEDERSLGFMPIVPGPKDVKKTRVRISHLPGFHGTGNGNVLSHHVRAAYDAKFDLQYTRDVQYLMFYTMLQFLEVHGVSLVTESKTTYYLDAFYSRYRATTLGQADRAGLFYDVYEAILKNIRHYRQYRTSTYPAVPIGTLRYEPEHVQGERKVMGYLDQTQPRALSEYVDFDIERSMPLVVNLDHLFCAFATLDIYDPEVSKKTDPQRLVACMQQWSELYDHIDSQNARMTQILPIAFEQLARYYFSRNLSEEDCRIVSEMVVACGQNLLVQPYIISALIAECSRSLFKLNQSIEGNTELSQNVLADFLKSANAYYTAIDRLVLRLQDWNKRIAHTALRQYQTSLQTLLEGFEIACENVVYRNDFQLPTDNLSKFERRMLLHRSFRTQSARAHADATYQSPMRRRDSVGDGDYTNIRLRLFKLQSAHVLLDTKIKTATILTQYITSNLANDSLHQLQDLLTQNEASQTALNSSKTKNFSAQKILGQVTRARFDLEEHGNPYYISGLNLQIVGGFILVLGLATVALALTCLLLSYLSLGAATAGICVGTGIALLGMFGLYKGSQIEGEQCVLTSMVNVMPNGSP